MYPVHPGFLPPGYRENHLERYPVLYMHDGKNLFLPEEAFLGREWRVDETLERLEAMNLIEQVIVVALHAGDRMRDYTAPGYRSYGRALVDTVKPWIDRHFLITHQRMKVVDKKKGRRSQS